MRKSSLLIMVGLVGLFGLTLTGAEKPPDDYVKAMKDLGGVAQAIGKPGFSEDFATAVKSGATAKASFEVAQKYWSAKPADDAKKLANAGWKSASDLGIAASLMSSEGVEQAAKEIMGYCGTCHTAHREKMPDGSFQIK